MGFKRTTEGRVFFQNADTGQAEFQRAQAKQSTAKPKIPNTNKELSNRINQQKQDSTQKQIIALLKTLNDKLQSSQSDRKKLQQELETYKMMVLGLQEKAEKQEQESFKIRKELSQKNTVSAKKINEAEKLSREAFKEFEEARRLIAEIEERSERTESLVKKQQIQVRQAEEQSRVKWDDLKKKSKKEIQDLMLRLESTESSQKLLDERIEEAANQTLKLDRKIEKTIHDRSRLIRKLERIEETVLQTNEAMNARAMVLLTDQGTAENSGYSHKPALQNNANLEEVSKKSEEDLYFDIPWWRKPMRMQAVSVSMVVIAAVVMGWGISEIQKPDGFQLSVPDSVVSAWETTSNAIADSTSFQNQNEQISVERSSFGSEQQTALLEQQNTNADIIPVEAETLLENPAVSEFDAIMEEQLAKTEKADDIGAIDLNNEEQLVALLEENPDLLAAELNKIEPSAIPETDTQIVQELPRERQAIIELNENVDLPSELQGTLFDRIKADRNLPEQLKEIENAAFSGNAEAQHDLAAIYIAGHGGVTQDYSRASLWFEEAAHNGIANARYNLGVLYHQGIGVKKDIDKAFDWYKTAASLGHPEAQYNLGIAYIEGIGVPYNPQQAAYYFENSANSGVIEAAYNIGLIYENGLLGKAEPDTALMWYKRAADKGSPEAKAALNQLANTLGMSISDVNKLIEGMEVLQGTSDQKKIVNSTQTNDEIGSVVIDKTESSIKDNGGNIVSLVQQELMDLGLYPGPVDGVLGMMTTDAVKTYQSRNNLTVNGKIDETLLSHMQFQMIGETEGVFEQGSREN